MNITCIPACSMYILRTCTYVEAVCVYTCKMYAFMHCSQSIEKQDFFKCQGPCIVFSRDASAANIIHSKLGLSDCMLLSSSAFSFYQISICSDHHYFGICFQTNVFF